MITKDVTYKGTIDPETDVSVEHVTGSESKLVDADGEPVPCDAKGVALVDTHQYKSFPYTETVARLEVGGEKLEIRDRLDATKLALKESPKELRARYAARFAAQYGLAVKK